MYRPSFFVYSLAKHNAMLHSFLIVILSSLFQYFTSPDNASRPYVRWWWNGDKVEKNELIRELNLLHEAGIGGVEINPIA